MKYYEINETAARQARECWSFRDYQHAVKQQNIKQKLTSVTVLLISYPTT